MQESPTKDMKFDVCSIPFERPKKILSKPGTAEKHVHITVLDTYPALKMIKSFPLYSEESSYGLKRDLVIRYIILLYSEDSILSKKPLAPLEERKFRALDLAGFERSSLNGDYHEDIVESLLLLNDDIVVDMVMDYLQYLHNDIWTEINIISQELEEYRRIRMSPVSAEHDKDLIVAIEKKDKLRLSSETMVKQLKEYQDIFYGDNLDLKAKSKKKRKTLESRAKNQ